MDKFIQQSIAVYLVLILLLRMMAMPLSLIDYSVNKGFISGNLCENKLKPEMHCAGKCFLSKQLTKTNDAPDSRDQKGGAKIGIIDFFEPTDYSSYGFLGFRSKQFIPFTARPIPSVFITSIFHPPLV
jgi:hypothetical protein